MQLALAAVTAAIVLADVVPSCGGCGGSHNPYRNPPPDDWASYPAQTLQGNAGGVAYQIALPGDFELREGGWVTQSDLSLPHPIANVVRLAAPVASLDDATSRDADEPDAYVRRAQRADGYALTVVHGQTLIRVTRFLKTAGGDSLQCTAAYSNDRGVTHFDATRRALEAICDSVVSK